MEGKNSKTSVQRSARLCKRKKTSDSAKVTGQEELSGNVFGNDLIRDEIFQHLLPGLDILTRKIFLKCKLVNSSWLNYNTKLLARISVPVFTVDFTHWKESRERQNGMKKRYQVQNFFDIWLNYPGASNRIPPFKLVLPELSGAVPTALMYDFAKCLKMCGNGLHTLTLNLSNRLLVNIAISKRLVTAVSKLHLPKLVILEVILPYEEGNRKLVNLLMSRILSGCEQLRSLKIRHKFYTAEVPLTRLFDEEDLPGETEHLPETLTEIIFSAKMTHQLLQNLMLENTLPNLVKLSVCGELVGGNAEVISRILKRYGQQLKWFTCVGDVIDSAENDMDQDERNLLTLIKFPVMTKLTNMNITSFHFMGEARQEQCFPVLKSVTLDDHTSTMLFNFTQNCCFYSVKQLTIAVCSKNSSNDDNFTLDLSRQMHAAFPNVQELRLTVRGQVEDGSMANIFEHMTQLQNLSVNLLRSEDIVGPSTWNAILLGVTLEYAENLASAPHLWDSVSLDDHRAPSQSIINLTKLKTLSLNKYKRYEGDTENMLISDVVFRFAFLCMPALVTLNLSGKFRASDEMRTLWRQQDRHIS